MRTLCSKFSREIRFWYPPFTGPVLLRANYYFPGGVDIISEEAMPQQPAYQRGDISDQVGNKLAPHLPGRKGVWGGAAKDNRQCINAVFWVLRTGAPWRDLPTHYEHWGHTHQRFCRWRDNGTWERLWEILAHEPDYTWLMIDARPIKVHPHGRGAVGGNEAMNRPKGGSIRKGAQYKTKLGRGCVWYAAQSHYYRRYRGRL